MLKVAGTIVSLVIASTVAGCGRDEKPRALKPEPYKSAQHCKKVSKGVKSLLIPPALSRGQSTVFERYRSNEVIKQNGEKVLLELKNQWNLARNGSVATMDSMSPVHQVTLNDGTVKTLPAGESIPITPLMAPKRIKFSLTKDGTFKAILNPVQLNQAASAAFLAGSDGKPVAKDFANAVAAGNYGDGVAADVDVDMLFGATGFIASTVSLRKQRFKAKFPNSFRLPLQADYEAGTADLADSKGCLHFRFTVKLPKHETRKFLKLALARTGKSLTDEERQQAVSDIRSGKVDPMVIRNELVVDPGRKKLLASFRTITSGSDRKKKIERFDLRRKQ